MRTNNARSKKGAERYAFFLAVFSCVLGLFFCLIKSPQSKSEIYLALSEQALSEKNQDLAISTALEAVRLNPATAKGWALLSELLQKKGQYHQASRARTIASLLQQNPDLTPLTYAVPAELRLSFLAVKDADHP